MTGSVYRPLVIESTPADVSGQRGLEPEPLTLLNLSPVVERPHRLLSHRLLKLPNQEGGTGQGTRREEPAKEPGGRNRPRNQEGGTGQGIRREEPAKEPGGRNRPRNQEGGTGQGTRREGRELGREVGRKRGGKGGSTPEPLDPHSLGPSAQLRTLSTPNQDLQTPEANTRPADSAALSSLQPPSWLHVITARYLLTNLEEVWDPAMPSLQPLVRDLQLVAAVVNLSPASSRPRATQGPLWVPL
ncbi:unnamed protein product [Boreogadus saida]